MNNIVQELIYYAESLDMQAAYVNDTYDLNTIMSNMELSDGGECLLIFPISGSGSGVASDLELKTILMFGRKNEGDTVSSLSETTQQKWDNRIYELYNSGLTFVNNFFKQCGSQMYDLGAYNFLQSINRTSSNIDFAQIEISFTEWKQ